MGDEITTTNVLEIELTGAGDTRRIIRISDPLSGITRAQITETLEPVLFPKSSADSDTTIPFFYDDNDASVPMTAIGTTQIIITEKTVRNLT